MLIRAALTALLATGVAARTAWPQQQPPSAESVLLDAKFWANPPPESEPAFTSAQVDGWVSELSPIVEQAAGRRFLRKPAVKMVSRAAFAAALARDLAAQGDDSSDAAGGSPSVAERLAVIMAARYVAADQTIYVPGRSLKPLLAALKIQEDRLEPLIKLVLLHELAHALQDQHVGVNRLLRRAANPGHTWTIKQLLEGHAVLVQRLAAARLRPNAAAVDANRLIPARATPELLSSLPTPQREVLRHHHLAHGGATGAMVNRFGGDSQRIWELLRNPPEIVFRPPPSNGEVLRGLDARFGRSWEKVDFAAGGADAVMNQFRTLESAAKKQIAASVRHVQIMNCRANISDLVPVLGNVTLFILADPKLAPALVGHINEAQRRSIEKGPLADIGTIEPGKQRELKLSGDRKAFAVRWSQALSETARLRQSLYLAIHGRYVVQVLSVNFDPSDAAVASIMNEVLSRVTANDKKSARAKP